MELVSSPHETPRELSYNSFGVSRGELTSSKLKAPSYDEAVNRAPTTDYRPPTTKPLASTPLFSRIHFHLILIRDKAVEGGVG